MNQLTALFMQQLSSHAPQPEEILTRVRRELARELERRLQMELDPGTIYCSGAGEELCARMSDWRRRAERIARPMEAVDCLRKLDAVCEDAKRLHGETREQLRTPGRPDEQKLYYLYMSEQREASALIEEWIQIDLYRILALGGAKYFRRIPPLASVSPMLSDRIRYYKEQVSPALALLDNQRKYGYWTIQRREGCHAGPVGTLTLYTACSPLRRGRRLTPGEYQTEETADGTIWQGSGHLTNVTPRNIVQAQSETIYDTVEAAALAEALQHMDPVQALGACFAGRWYAVAPHALFSMASMWEISRILARREQLELCCCCGAPARRGASLCQSCMQKVCANE